MSTNSGYVQRLHARTGTRLWVNNPTIAEAQQAIALGIVNCTSNPTFSARIIREEPAAALPIVDAVLQECADDRQAAALIQERLIARIMQPFQRPWAAAPRREGFVSIQGDPELEDDADHIIHEMLRARTATGPNFLAKIPATAAGLTAIAAMVAEDIPFIATEVFSLSQAAACCELYQRESARTGKRPPFFLTHISGIFDEQLAAYAKAKGVDLAPDLIRQAGVIVARAQYRLACERGWPCTMLGGGARGMHHVTEVVGGSMHVTINWSTVEELQKADPPLIERISASAPAEVVAELVHKLPDLRDALIPGAQPVEAFADYAPVRHFREIFTKGWRSLLDTVKTRRAATATAAR